LRRYPTEQEIISLFRSPGLFRRRVWRVIRRLLKTLPLVRKKKRKRKKKVTFFLQIPWSKRHEWNGYPAAGFSVIVDTIDTKACMPSGLPFSETKKYRDTHKYTWGVKWEVGVAFARRPRLVWFSGPFRAAESDIKIAQAEGGVLDHLGPDERALGDPGYHGDSRIYAGFKKNMRGYIRPLKHVGLTLQRVVERWNRFFRTWKIIDHVRLSPKRDFKKIEDVGHCVALLISLDQQINQYKY